jgi:NTP pyrophosphatase (non-canonical NTP hydrolase)
MTSIFQRAVDHYGVARQLSQAEEEAVELAHELIKLRHGKGDLAALISEIADVEIMCAQLRVIYGDHEIDKAIDAKLTRLDERMRVADSIRAVAP